MTMYKHCVVKKVSKSIVELNSTLDSMRRWSFRLHLNHINTSNGVFIQHAIILPQEMAVQTAQGC